MELHIMFTDKYFKFHSITKKWTFEYAERFLNRIKADYWEIGVNDANLIT